MAYTSYMRSVNARKQLRDRYGRWIEMGGIVKFRLLGKWFSGVVTDFSGSDVKINYRDENGSLSSIKLGRKEVESIPSKAVLGKHNKKVKSHLPAAKNKTNLIKNLIDLGYTESEAKDIAGQSSYEDALSIFRNNESGKKIISKYQDVVNKVDANKETPEEKNFYDKLVKATNSLSEYYNWKKKSFGSTTTKKPYEADNQDIISRKIKDLKPGDQILMPVDGDIYGIQHHDSTAKKQEFTGEVLTFVGESSAKHPNKNIKLYDFSDEDGNVTSHSVLGENARVTLADTLFEDRDQGTKNIVDLTPEEEKPTKQEGVLVSEEDYKDAESGTYVKASDGTWAEQQGLTFNKGPDGQWEGVDKNGEVIGYYTNSEMEESIGSTNIVKSYEQVPGQPTEEDILNSPEGSIIKVEDHYYVIGTNGEMFSDTGKTVYDHQLETKHGPDYSIELIHKSNKSIGATPSPLPEKSMESFQNKDVEYYEPEVYPTQLTVGDYVGSIFGKILSDPVKVTHSPSVEGVNLPDLYSVWFQTSGGAVYNTTLPNSKKIKIRKKLNQIPQKKGDFILNKDQLNNLPVGAKISKVSSNGKIQTLVKTDPNHFTYEGTSVKALSTQLNPDADAWNISLAEDVNYPETKSQFADAREIEIAEAAQKITSASLNDSEFPKGTVTTFKLKGSGDLFLEIDKNYGAMGVYTILDKNGDVVDFINDATIHNSGVDPLGFLEEITYGEHPDTSKFEKITDARVLDKLPSGSKVAFGNMDARKLFIHDGNGTWTATWLPETSKYNKVSSDDIMKSATLHGQSVDLVEKAKVPQPQPQPAKKAETMFKAEDAEIGYSITTKIDKNSEQTIGLIKQDYDLWVDSNDSGDTFTDKNINAIIRDGYINDIQGDKKKAELVNKISKLPDGSTIYDPGKGVVWVVQDGVISDPQGFVTVPDEIVDYSPDIDAILTTEPSNYSKTVKDAADKLDAFAKNLQGTFVEPEKIVEYPLGSKVHFYDDNGVSATVEKVLPNIWTNSKNGTKFTDEEVADLSQNNKSFLEKPIFSAFDQIKKLPIGTIVTGESGEQYKKIGLAVWENVETGYKKLFGIVNVFASAKEVKQPKFDENTIFDTSSVQPGEFVTAMLGVSGQRATYEKQLDGGYINKDTGFEYTDADIDEYAQVGALTKTPNQPATEQPAQAPTPTQAKTVSPDEISVGDIVVGTKGEVGKVVYVNSDGTQVKVNTPDGNTKFWKKHLVSKTTPDKFPEDAQVKYAVKKDASGEEYVIVSDGNKVYVGDLVVSSGKTGFEGVVTKIKADGQFVYVKDVDGVSKLRKVDKVSLVKSNKKSTQPGIITPEQVDLLPPGSILYYKSNKYDSNAVLILGTDGDWHAYSNQNQVKTFNTAQIKNVAGKGVISTYPYEGQFVAEALEILEPLAGVSSDEGKKPPYLPGQEAAIAQIFDDSSAVSRHLRGTGKGASEGVFPVIRDIDTLIKNSSLSSDTTVYAAFSTNDQKIIDKILNADTFRDKSFVKGSENLDYIHSLLDSSGKKFPVLVEFDLPKGFHAHHINYGGFVGQDLSEYADKKQVILPRALNYKIIDRVEFTDVHGNKGIHLKVQGTVVDPMKALESPNLHQVASKEDVPEHPFQVLDDPGLDGDGYHPSGPWGLFGASGLLVQAIDPDTGEPKYLIVENGELHEEKYQGLWQLPGGAANGNENAYQGAAREMHEELGVPVSLLESLNYSGEVRFENGHGWSYTNIAATASEMFDVEVDIIETSDHKWVTKEELLQMAKDGKLLPVFADNVPQLLEEFKKSEPLTTDVNGEPIYIGDTITYGKKNSVHTVTGMSKTSPDFITTTNEQGQPYSLHKSWVSKVNQESLEFAEIHSGSEIQTLPEGTILSTHTELHHANNVLYVKQSDDAWKSYTFDEDNGVWEFSGDFIPSSELEYFHNEGIVDFSIYKGKKSPEFFDGPTTPTSVESSDGLVEVSDTKKFKSLPIGTIAHLTEKKNDNLFYVKEADDTWRVYSEGVKKDKTINDGAFGVSDTDTDMVSSFWVDIPEESKFDHHIDEFDKIGGQGGSNSGALYVKKTTGEKYYIKWGMSEDHAKDEVLASKIYEALGIRAARQEFIDMGDGTFGVASKIIDTKGSSYYKLTDKDFMDDVYDGYAADVLLDNWDVAGLSFDNLLEDEDGHALRIDPGASLRHRAQGKKKHLHPFGPNADAWDFFRDGSNNESSSLGPIKNLYKNITDEDLYDSAQKLNELSDDDIDKLVDSVDYDPETAAFMKDALKARKKDILARAEKLKKPEQVETPEPVLTSTEQKMPTNLDEVSALPVGTKLHAYADKSKGYFIKIAKNSWDYHPKYNILNSSEDKDVDDETIAGEVSALLDISTPEHTFTKGNPLNTSETFDLPAGTKIRYKLHDFSIGEVLTKNKLGEWKDNHGNMVLTHTQAMYAAEGGKVFFEEYPSQSILNGEYQAGQDITKNDLELLPVGTIIKSTSGSSILKYTKFDDKTMSSVNGTKIPIEDFDAKGLTVDFLPNTGQKEIITAKTDYNSIMNSGIGSVINIPTHGEYEKVTTGSWAIIDPDSEDGYGGEISQSKLLKIINDNYSTPPSWLHYESPKGGTGVSNTQGSQQTYKINDVVDPPTAANLPVGTTIKVDGNPTPHSYTKTGADIWEYDSPDFKATVSSDSFTKSTVKFVITSLPNTSSKIYVPHGTDTVDTIFTYSQGVHAGETIKIGQVVKSDSFIGVITDVELPNKITVTNPFYSYGTKLSATVTKKVLNPKDLIPVDSEDLISTINENLVGGKIVDATGGPIKIGDKVNASFSPLTSTVIGYDGGNLVTENSDGFIKTLPPQQLVVVKEEPVFSYEFPPKEPKTTPSGPTVLDKYGAKIAVGSIVDWENVGKTGLKVIDIDTDLNKVKVVYSDNTKHWLASKKMKVVSTPDTQPVSKPALKKIEIPSPDIDESHPLYGTEKPTPPVKPNLEELEAPTFFPDGFIAKIEERYKQKINPKWSKSSVQQSNYWNKIQQYGTTGDTFTLGFLKEKMFIDDDMYNEAMEHRNGVLEKQNEFNLKKKQLEDEYADKLNKYNETLKTWKKVNGFKVKTVADASPPLASIEWTESNGYITNDDGTKSIDWSLSAPGTFAVSDIMSALEASDQLGMRGLSTLIDSSSIVGSNVRFIKVVDKSGVVKIQAKFEVSQHAINAVKLTMGNALHSGVYEHSEQDFNHDGMTVYDPLNLDKHAAKLITHHGSTFVREFGDTIISLEHVPENGIGSWKHGDNGHSFLGNMYITMPETATADDFGRALQAAGIADAHPSDRGSVEFHIKKALVSQFDGFIPEKITTYEEDHQLLDEKAEAVLSKLGYSLSDFTVVVDSLGFVRFKLPDELTNKLVKDSGITYLVHGNYDYTPEGVSKDELAYNTHSAPTTLSRLIRRFVGPTRGYQATALRVTEGDKQSGMSKEADIASGGARYLFTRPVKGQAELKPGDSASGVSASYNTALIMHPKSVFQYLGVYANEDDQGDGRRDPGLKAMDVIKNHYHISEVMIPHGVGAEDVWFVMVSSSYYDIIMKEAAEMGITEINGVPIEEFFVKSSSYNEPSPSKIPPYPQANTLQAVPTGGPAV